jgi:hypothetical protein
VLFEDFTEDESADARSKLLAALGLAQRRGLSREEIEAALLRFGGEILKNSLSLDPLEFRLVCIPYDLYGRLGRERGFGKWGRISTAIKLWVAIGCALLPAVTVWRTYDLVSISPSDAREGVYARFAVVRRARQILRWR